ncbi:hypothetical protein STEG23_035283, partial [Scotinomys teguina]
SRLFPLLQKNISPEQQKKTRYIKASITSLDNFLLLDILFPNVPYYIYVHKTNPTAAQAQTQSYDFAHINIHPIYDMLEHIVN